MRIILLIISFLCLYANAQNFEKHIIYLASDELNGRLSGTKYEQMAANYISKALTDSFDNKLQDFDFVNEKGITSIAKNLIAFSKKNNKNDSSIILIAHYDHVGTGEYKSREILSEKKNQIHNGADDNASGVAMVIELGNYFANKNNFHYNLILLFPSAHEIGIYGANHFVENFDWKNQKIKAVLNFDMIGRLDSNNKVLGVSCENDFIQQISNSSQKLGIHILKEDYFNRTDLKPFLGHSNLLINFSTGTHEDYHRITDDAYKINYQGMNELFELFKDVINGI
jgi:Zn-dependent M28 family amino/carboxypeptidase